MNRERLTPDTIRHSTPPEGAGQAFLWDTDAPRRAVRVTAGAKSFIFESKLNRQTIRITIGDVRTWELDAARTEARRLQARSILKVHVFDRFPEIAATPAREVTALQIAALVRQTREAGRVRAGNRALSADELRAYLAALGDDLPDQALRLALLAGGQRMAQLLRANASDDDPEAQTLRLWDGKRRRVSPREHVLPLAPRAAAMVAALVDRAHAMESPLLFFNGRQGTD